jgi:hypothetical protein
MNKRQSAIVISKHKLEMEIARLKKLVRRLRRKNEELQNELDRRNAGVDYN